MANPYKKKEEDAGRHKREREQHQNNVEIISALHSLVREQEAARDQEHAYERSKGRREWLTIVGLALAALAACAALYQGYIFHSTMTDAQKQSAAFVYVRGLDIEPIPDSPQANVLGAAFTIAPIVANNGTTQAKCLKYWQISSNGGYGPDNEFGPGDPEDFFQAIEPETVPLLLGPKAEKTIPIETLSEGQLKMLPHHAWYIWGALHYRDIFYGEHLTKYCFEVHLMDVRADGKKWPRFRECRHWNCADNGECDSDRAQFEVEMSTVPGAQKWLSGRVAALHEDDTILEPYKHAERAAIADKECHGARFVPTDGGKQKTVPKP